MFLPHLHPTSDQQLGARQSIPQPGVAEQVDQVNEDEAALKPLVGHRDAGPCSHLFTPCLHFSFPVFQPIPGSGDLAFQLHHLGHLDSTSQLSP